MFNKKQKIALIYNTSILFLKNDSDLFIHIFSLKMYLRQSLILRWTISTMVLTNVHKTLISNATTITIKYLIQQ